MSDEHPLPGDTIEITWDFDNWKGKQYVVVECPESNKGTMFGDNPSNAWVIVEGEKIPSYFLFGNYKIVARANGQSDVDKSLDRQRDNNLRGVFT